jgi:hypothetical protein
MSTVIFPYKHTGKPRIVSYIDGTIAVALKTTTIGKGGRALPGYKLAYFNVSNNPHLIQALTTKNYIGLESILNGTISTEKFNQAKTALVKRL